MYLYVTGNVGVLNSVNSEVQRNQGVGGRKYKTTYVAVYGSMPFRVGETLVYIPRCVPSFAGPAGAAFHQNNTGLVMMVKRKVLRWTQGTSGGEFSK